MHRTVFGWMLATSLVGLTLSAIFGADAPKVFLAGLIPLVIYHAVLIRESRKGLSQVMIDSVYYFGFLVTIATLAVSVLLFSYKHRTGTQTSDVLIIVNQFGLGLLATGYALFARMHLMSIATQAEDLGPIALAEQYARKVKEVADRITISAVGFETFATTITEKNRQIVEATTNTLKNLSIDAAERLQADMRSLVAEIRTSMETFARSMKESNPSAEIDAFKHQMRSLSGSVTNASTRLKTLQDSTGLIEGSFNKLSTTSESIRGALDNSIPKLEKIPLLAQHLLELKEVTKDVCEKMGSVKEQLVEMNKQISENSRDMSKSYNATASSLSQSASDAEEAVKILTKDLTRMVNYIIDQTRESDPRS